MKYGTALPALITAVLLASCAPSSGKEPAAADEQPVAVQAETDNTASPAAAGNVGETMRFGTYPQDTEEAEPIEWLILDVQEDRTLLITKNCIETLPWHNSHESVTWDRSDIRTWLNEGFLLSAFSPEEQERILPSDLDNGDDLNYGTPVGENTTDRVFLLSAAELESCFPSDSDRTVKPTKHAVSHGAYTNGSGDCAWWLRSPGMTATSPAYIASGGSIGNRAHEVDETIIGVRPAIWVETGSSGQPVSKASDLWNRYDRDPDKYTATYSGDTETVTGVIAFIGTDSHGTPSMELSDTAGGRPCVLGVFGSFDEMSEVSEGDTVTITGNFHIMSSENMVVLKQCRIINSCSTES